MAIETTEYLQMVRRMLRAAGRRVADADEIELADLMDMRNDLEEAIKVAVHGQRSTGRSWEHIAVAAGTSRQAAFARYAK